MRVLPFLPAALIFVLAGCAAVGSGMIEEAEPLAPGAVESVDSLVVYLEASGIDVTLVESEVGPITRTRAIRSTVVRFAQGGPCRVLTYGSAADAEQFGPEAGEYQVSRRTEAFNTDFVHTGTRFKEPYQLGVLVAACFDEDPLVFRALRSLEDFAESDS